MEGHEETHGDPLFVYPDVPSISPPSSAEAGILSGASKHVDFSLALTRLAHGAAGVNELVFDSEGWSGWRGRFISTQPRSVSCFMLE